MRATVLAVLLWTSSSLLADDFTIGSKVTTISVGQGSSRSVLNPADAPATVVVFLSTRCPISNSYIDRLAALFTGYSSKGVRFAFVNANSNETADEIEEHAKANKIPFPIYKDADDSLANELGATVTPEVYVFDRGGVLRYHGYVDDSRNEARVRVHGTSDAIDAVLAAKPVGLQSTKAFGCTIKKVRKAL